MAEDVFQINQILKLQEKILLNIADEPDIAVKIAALRAAAELLQHATTMAMLTAQYRSLIGGRN